MTLRLELLAERHLPFFEPLLADGDTLRFTRIPEPIPPGFAERWLARYEAGRLDGTREAFVAVEGEEPLALALAPEIDRDAGEAELGYMTWPHARGRGVASGALRLLTDWAFSEGIVRAYLLIARSNEGSKRVAERAGYQREGVMRSKFLKDGLREDTELWSRLSTDVRV
jgi:RimJ/RimL family protein N-acetyltransferase